MKIPEPIMDVKVSSMNMDLHCVEYIGNCICVRVFMYESYTFVDLNM